MSWEPFLVAVGLAAGYLFWDWKPRCSMGIFMCGCFRDPLCSDGRCRHHCKLYCKCRRDLARS